MSKLTQEDSDVELIWCAFELRPDPVPTLDPKGEYLQRVWRDSVYPLSDRLGFNMKLPSVQPRSRKAHEAAHWARSAGYFNEYNLAIFRAFFEKGEDIGKIDVLVGIRAVPAFVVGDQMMLSGVQPLDRLKDLVVWARSIRG